jgi:uncharacterized glyoxalase superfamily protein PhnB
LLAGVQPKSSRLTSVCPHLIVPDVVAAAEYFRDKLGFQIRGYWMDPPVFAIVSRDQVAVHIGKADEGVQASPNQRRSMDGLDAYIWVTELDALYAELQQRGANIVEGPVHRVYNCYEIVVEDPFGFRISFAEDTSSRSG